MISYSDEEQVNQVFKQVCAGKYTFQKQNYLISNTRRLTAWGSSLTGNRVYLRDEPEMGTCISRKELLNEVINEMVRRERIMKEKKSIHFKRYHSLNTWNEQKLAYQFLLIDDIWDMVTAKPKSLGITLIRILLYGPAVGIHSIIASGISYRNLLQQLVTINPAISNELQKKYGIPEPTQIGMLGEEIIFTPDDLIYHKKSSMTDMERYFKI